MPDKMVRVRQLAFFGDVDVDLNFPDMWEVVPCYMKGHDRPRMSEAALPAAFDNPIGTPRMRDMAAGKKEVVIFDDMARPTNVAELAPYVVRELAAARLTAHQLQDCHDVSEAQ